MQQHLHTFLRTYLPDTLRKITRALTRHAAELPLTTTRTLTGAVEQLHAALPAYTGPTATAIPRLTADTAHHAILLQRLLRHTPGLPAELAELHATLTALLKA